MRGILLLSVLVATVLVVAAEFKRVKPPTRRNYPAVMSPRDRYRFRREANPQGVGSVAINKAAGKPPTLNLDYQHNMWSNKNGQITGGIAAQKMPGQKWDANANLRGTYQKGNGQLSGGINQPLTGPNKRPSFDVGYQHNIWKSKNGQISAGVGAQKFPGQKWQPNVEVQGTWRIPG